MKRVPTFDLFREDFLLFAASKQDGQQLKPIGVFWVAQSHFPEIPDAWRVEAVQMLERQGFGTSHNTGDDQEFWINGEGISEAERIRRSRTKIGRLVAFGIENWLSLFALVISILALFK